MTGAQITFSFVNVLAGGIRVARRYSGALHRGNVVMAEPDNAAPQPRYRIKHPFIRASEIAP